MKVDFFYVRMPGEHELNQMYPNKETLVHRHAHNAMLLFTQHFPTNVINGVEVALYAISLDKFASKMFLEMHNKDLVFKSTRKMTQEEIDNEIMFKPNIHDLLLQEHGYRKFDDDELLIYYLNNRMDEFIFGIFSSYIYDDLVYTARAPYDSLKEKYIFALDKLLYCTYHQRYFGKDIEVSEVADYNYNGYGITVEGYKAVTLQPDNFQFLLDYVPFLLDGGFISESI